MKFFCLYLGCLGAEYITLLDELGMYLVVENRKFDKEWFKLYDMYILYLIINL